MFNGFEPSHIDLSLSDVSRSFSIASFALEISSRIKISLWSQFVSFSLLAA